MCGLVGFIDFNFSSSREILRSMVETHTHRGPDGKGYDFFELENCQVGLGHARLSIIDLSVDANQPFHYGDYSIVFNGEIYNYNEIRNELIELKHSFRTHSDTEVILHSFQEWGEKCVERFIGMFAIVILDHKKNEVTVFRDRAGVKPFYYYWENRKFIFASELKGILSHPGFKKVINTKAIPQYLNYGYIPGPASIYANTNKLPAARILKINLKNGEMTQRSYWSVVDYYVKPRLTLSFNDARDHLHSLLISACKYRMISDVPVGVFLSGGYDSSAVAAIVQKHTNEQVRTFTIGYSEGINEAPFARKTANMLQTDHYEQICTVKDVERIIPMLPYYFDEPFADSSAIPTMLVSQLARTKVAAAISADGGDEIFGGYVSYLTLYRYQKMLNKVPARLKHLTGVIMREASRFPFLFGIDTRHKLYSAGISLKTRSNIQSAELFRLMNSVSSELVSGLLLEKTVDHPVNLFNGEDRFRNEIDAAMAYDFIVYMQDDILAKVDRATMSVGLEGREPLLDHRIVEFAAQLPTGYKFDGVGVKKILKSIVHEYIPESDISRPKAGFGAPVNRWLRVELSYLLDEYLSPDRIAQTGVFNPAKVTELVKQFKADKLHYKTLMWRLLAYQLWHEKWMKP